MGLKLFAYADESGTFDCNHYEWFVYGGIVIAGTDAMQVLARRYVALERRLREEDPSLAALGELKAKDLSFAQRKRLYKALGMPGVTRFACLVDQQRIFPELYTDKRSKQRYCDYALKRAVKEGLKATLEREGIAPSDVGFVKLSVDEHTAATNAKYTLAESVDEELRHGVFSTGFSVFHRPLFPELESKVPVTYCDSKKATLVRAADIVANWVYGAARDQETKPDVMECVMRECVVLRLP